MNEVTPKDIKNLVIAICILVITIVVGILYNHFIKDDGQKASKKYLIIGNYLILQKTNTSWAQLNSFSEDLKKLKYTITDGKTTKENVTIDRAENTWYFYDKDYNQIKLPKFRIATHNITVMPVSYEIEYIDEPLEDEYVNQILSDNEIIDYEKESYHAVKVSIDLDSDGINEDIYTLNNSSLSETSDTIDIYGFLFIVKNNKITLLNKQQNRPLNLMEILDLNNDGKYELIVAEDVINLPTFDDCYLIYSNKNSKWQLIKDC